MTLTLHNTLTRKKEAFTPLDAKNVRMYVCGPTVYDRAHLGNARSVVVYDVLYRLLCHIYGADHVTYARNITDVDDKINAAAKERKITIKQLTTEVTGWFHEDMKALNVLPATSDKKINGVMIEPKATDHISEMIKIIERLISNGNAYLAQGNVLFSVKSMPGYGRLSGRIQDDLEAGARVKVESYKREASDFVLWKPADADDDPSSVFDSPWGKGRPGWHIECSAMSLEYLADMRFEETDPKRYSFDIHGGGSDLMFPHHENEIAQSVGAFPGSEFAKYWVHNGFLTVNGEKMSKSLGNFITVRDLLDKGVKGEVIRYALLSAKYNEPLDWNERLVHNAKITLDAAYRALLRVEKISKQDTIGEEKVAKFDPTQAVLNCLSADLNTPLAMSIIAGDTMSDEDFSGYTGMINNWLDRNIKENDAAKIKANNAAVKVIAGRFKESMQLLGFLQEDPEQWFKGSEAVGDNVEPFIAARNAAKAAKNWAEADRIRNELKSQGILLEDKPDGTTDWRRQ